ncbi:hypothetical protein ACIRS1_06090 [Kitasatospora sp. NPDC101176]|uniref:hypothetical protein n=1 Tax=Kitasatospora sp. NPDC101176 TaxID=3364099 RepID=UPI0037F57BE3
MTDHATPPQPSPQPPSELPPPPALAPLGTSEVIGTAPQAPAAPETPEEREARLARRTRRRRAALRWSTATLVFALAGTGAALAVTAPERTDIPGLATASDGRYTFPPLALPPLPAGKSAPDPKGKGLHQADLRHLLLPTPKEAGGPLTAPTFPAPSAPPSAGPSASASAGASASAPASASASATASPAPSATGPAPADWVPCDAVLAEQQNPAALGALLVQDACRAATVREWTASDGTRTQIRLLRFGSSAESWDVFSSLRSDSLPKALPGVRVAAREGWDAVPGIDLSTKETSVNGAKGTPTARLAYLSASDVLAVITMTNPDGVPAAAFRQVVTLQSDLLA